MQFPKLLMSWNAASLRRNLVTSKATVHGWERSRGWMFCFVGRCHKISSSSDLSFLLTGFLMVSLLVLKGGKHSIVVRHPYFPPNSFSWFAGRAESWGTSITIPFSHFTTSTVSNQTPFVQIRCKLWDSSTFGNSIKLMMSSLDIEDLVISTVDLKMLVDYVRAGCQPSFMKESM